MRKHFTLSNIILGILSIIFFSSLKYYLLSPAIFELSILETNLFKVTIPESISASILTLLFRLGLKGIIEDLMYTVKSKEFKIPGTLKMEQGGLPESSSGGNEVTSPRPTSPQPTSPQPTSPEPTSPKPTSPKPSSENNESNPGNNEPTSGNNEANSPQPRTITYEEYGEIVKGEMNEFKKFVSDCSEHIGKVNDVPIFLDQRIETQIAINGLIKVESSMLHKFFSNRDIMGSFISKTASPEDLAKLKAISAELHQVTVKYYDKVSQLSEQRSYRSAVEQFWIFTNTYRSDANRLMNQSDLLAQKIAKQSELYKVPAFKKAAFNDYNEAKLNFNKTDAIFKKNLEETFKKKS